LGTFNSTFPDVIDAVCGRKHKADKKNLHQYRVHLQSLVSAQHSKWLEEEETYTFTLQQI
jgi:hypothetical protein